MKQVKQQSAGKNSTVTVAVLGGGASGMMAALAAAQSLERAGAVAVFERNPSLGQKLLATGNGRCNLSNLHCSSGDFGGISAEKEGDLIESVLDGLPVFRTLDLFRKLGIPVREETQGRLYPYSMQAVSVRDGLVEALLQKGVQVQCGNPVTGLFKEKDADHFKGRGFDLSSGKGSSSSKGRSFDLSSERGSGFPKEKDADHFKGRDFDLSSDRESGLFRIELADGSVWHAQKVILAMGGMAGGQYGCRGDGYEIARALGHRILSPVPALVQLESDDPALKRLAGVRVRGKVSLWEKRKKSGEASGEIQFTEKGLSGICLFDVSRFLRWGTEGRSIQVALDLMPELSEKKALEELVWRRKQLPNRPLIHFLDGILPQKLGLALMERLEAPAESSLSGEMDFSTLQAMAALLKDWRFSVTGTRPWNEAQVTAGGVDLSEVSKGSLESRRVSGLYLAGELLDVDGPCGGYNLQWAWSSGYAAGISAAESGMKWEAENERKERTSEGKSIRGSKLEASEGK